MRSVNVSILCVALAGLAFAQTGPTGQLHRGEIAKHRFKEVPINGLGVTELADLRGKPVLVAYWGHTTWADDWVDDIVVWQKQFGSDLAVVMAEMQAADRETIESVALKKKWLGSRLMWTNEYPAFAGHSGVPQFSLLSNDGELILDGMPAVMGMNFVKRRLEEIEDAIAEQVRLRREGPDGAPANVAAAWKQFAAGQIGRAFAGARQLSTQSNGTGQKVVETAARVALVEFTRRIDRRLVRAAALLEEGRMVELDEELAGLDGQLDGEPELLARFEELNAARESDAYGAEREAAAALAKIQKKIDTKGLKKPTLRSLEKFAKKYPETKSAGRAQHWIALAAKR